MNIGGATPSKVDEDHLRAVIALASDAAARGQAPFAARLVDASGKVVAEAINTVRTSGDASAHAEMNLLRELAGTSPAVLRNATLYSNVEPCAMCAAAICWSAIGRVVYALAHTDMRRHAPRARREPGVLGRDLFMQTEDAPLVLGPTPQLDAAAPFTITSTTDP